MKIEQRYIDASYLNENPDWDREDAPWKAKMVKELIEKHQIMPSSICEIGCGSGDILACLIKYYSEVELTGYDVSPQLENFWKEHKDNSRNLNFCVGDFFKLNTKKYNVLLMLDVFEHVRDPYTFLEMSKQYADYFVFHIPLDLSASSVVREKPLMYTRKKVGHLHSYTKDLALETLKDSGFNIIEWQYTGASLNMPNRSLKTILAHMPRKLVYAINKDWGVRLLGGETLLVLAN